MEFEINVGQDSLPCLSLNKPNGVSKGNKWVYKTCTALLVNCHLTKFFHMRGRNWIAGKENTLNALLL